MQDYPPVADHGRHERRKSAPEPRQIHDGGITLWIAAATVIISLGILLLFNQSHVKNGGAPFVITPPTQISASPKASL